MPTTFDRTSDQYPALVAQIIRNIPRSDRDAAPLLDLLPFDDGQGAVEEMLLPLITLLEVFGAVHVTGDSSGDGMRIKARSETAIYFLRSLAEYVESGLAIVDNWEREGVGTDVHLAESFSSGAQIVYLLEKRRVAERPQSQAIRNVEVSQAVIKAQVNGQRDPMYLVQYDSKAQQYQMIGGRMRSSDADSLAVMKRELVEELPRNRLVYGEDYDLKELATDLRFSVISPTFGAFTSYRFTIFQATFKRRQLLLGPLDRWVTLEELLAGKSSDGLKIADGIASTLDEKLPGGVKSLDLSVEDVQKSSADDGASARRILTIFLASSAELKDERDAFELYFRQQNDLLMEQGTYLKIVRWENFLDAMSQTRLQDEYNKAIKQSDILVCLFATKTGRFTEEEFDVAHALFKSCGKPLIYTFFKKVSVSAGSENKQALMSLWAFQEKLSALGHFHTEYENIEHLKLRFSDQLKKLLAADRL